MSSRFVGTVIVVSVLISLCAYSAVIYYFVGPVDLSSVSNIASLGDSFGFLTSIFTGLAFSGMLIAILLQKEELKLQRVEIREGRIENREAISAHQVNVKLSALTSLLEEYRNRLNELENIAEPVSQLSWCDELEGAAEVKEKEESMIAELITHYSKRKMSVVREIERILIDSGIDLEQGYNDLAESVIENINDSRNRT